MNYKQKTKLKYKGIQIILTLSSGSIETQKYVNMLSLNADDIQKSLEL